MVSSFKIIRILEKAGWKFVGARGDHFKYNHPTEKGIVIVTHPRKDVTIGTLKAIEKQSGLKIREIVQKRNRK